MPPEPAEVDPALVGTEWFLTNLKGESPIEGTNITLEIGEEDAGGSSGCNLYGGPLDKMADGVLRWSHGDHGGFDHTDMGCRRPLLRQEESYWAALTAVDSYRLAGDRLTMTNNEGRTTLVFSRKPDWTSDPAALVGTRWVLRSINGERPVEGSTPTVSFKAEKEISWYDGCQNFSGDYHITGNDLSVPAFGVVEGDCMKPEVFEENADGTCLVGCFLPEGDYRLKDGLLEIRSETGETTSVLKPLERGEEPEQQGTPWALRNFAEGGKTTPVSGKAGIALTFDRGTLRRTGTMFGSTGCNDYKVAYEHPIARNGPDRLELAEPAVTKRGCSGARGLAERRFLGILRDVAYYPVIFADGTMRLDATDGRKLVFGPPE